MIVYIFINKKYTYTHIVVIVLILPSIVFNLSFFNSLISFKARSSSFLHPHPHPHPYI